MASDGGGAKPPMAVDFSGLLLGFSSAALYYMGHTGIEGRTPVTNLPLARQNIDILCLLRDKTQGNLSADEDKLIQQLIADLQVKMLAAGG